MPYGPGNPGPDVDLTVFLTSEALRLTGILLQPYMPIKAAQLLDQLGVDESRRTLADCRPGADLDYGVPNEKGKGLEVLFPLLPFENEGW